MGNSGSSSQGANQAITSPDWPGAERFILSGQSKRFDRRISAVRRDLVDMRFAGQVFAPHYAAPMTVTVAARTPLRAAPDPASDILSEVLAGETFDVLEVAEHRAWGISGQDGTVGYLDSTHLAALDAPSHIVTAVLAPVRADPADDSRAVTELPMGSRISVIRTQDGWIETAAGWMSDTDVHAIDDLGGDPVAVAEALAGTPAHSGGRSGAGLNCTGLVFLSYSMTGISVPRFCDLQREAIGVSIDASAELHRGDLVFFEDHVVMMRDSDNAVHVPFGGGPVRFETLESILAEGHFGEVVARKRPE